jgi:D-serine deaminase-like pyridoxal phosphate-dependent protein
MSGMTAVSRPPTAAATMDLRGSAALGATIAQLATPTLRLDLDVFEANSRRISDFLRARSVAWRPHAKGHRSPEIARRQLGFGAIGVTVSKVSEAELMAAGGIPSVLITTQQPTAARWARIAALQPAAEVIAPVDSKVHVALAAEAARAAGISIPIAVEVDLGIHRAGTQPGHPALDLARLVDATPGLHLVGLIGYEGHLLRRWPQEEKREAIAEAIGELTATADLLRQNGLEAGLVSAGGTGSYRITAELPGVTEIQAGGGCFMDYLYADECHVADLDFALTLVATVASLPSVDTATVDAGWKALPNDRVAPKPIAPADLTLRSLSAEHGVVVRGPDAPALAIGDQVTFVPGYHDATVFRHEAIYGVRGGRVETVFEVGARGFFS